MLDCETLYNNILGMSINLLIIPLVITVLILIGVVKYKKIKRNKALLADEWSKCAPVLSQYVDACTEFLAGESYISGIDIELFKQGHPNPFYVDDLKKYKSIKTFDLGLYKAYKNFSENLHELINLANHNFIQSEIEQTRTLLNSVEGYSLDEQQRNAVVVNEDNQIVVAGAGSGKTTTIVGKIKYLTQRLGVLPGKILIISFTRKSSDEMVERLRQSMGSAISVMTFHKLGLSIISSVTNEKPAIYDASTKTHSEIITSFINHLRKDEVYANKLLSFLTFYLKPYKDINEFKTLKEHDDYLRERTLVGYKSIKKVSGRGIEVTYRERYKSQEEVTIANFLFKNNIKYEYELKYEKRTSNKNFGQYKPDFYLPEYNLYIEHFGIDEYGNVPPFFKGNNRMTAKQLYNSGIEWKRRLHQQNQTVLLETYSWYQRDGILLSKLEEMLLAHNVKFRPMTTNELWLYIQTNAIKDIEDFTQLIITFLSQVKTKNISRHNLDIMLTNNRSQREKTFLELFYPIYELYEDYLRDNGLIDFNDMINNATELVEDDQYKSKFEYVLIDEFQDISDSRYRLIKAIVDQNPQTKLFCVGDDWQSIYRFAGSDIGLFTNFQEYFKKNDRYEMTRLTKRLFIENTYRFDDQLIKISSDFITKNPNQIPKNLKSSIKSKESPFTIIRYSDPERTWENTRPTLFEVFHKIHNTTDGKEVSILFIGRYSFDEVVLDKSEFLGRKYNVNSGQYEYYCAQYPKFKIRFLTAHASKGTQSDYVVLLNCNSGTYGFPSEVSDDPILTLLLSSQDQYPNSEERRLFYVALTRAKKHVYLLVNENHPSKFINEFEPIRPVNTPTCKQCGYGIVTIQKGPYGYFQSCTNYHYCNYTKKATNADIQNFAFRLSSNNELQKAIDIFEYLSGQKGFEIIAFLNLASLFARCSEYHKAILHSNNVLLLDPGNIEVLVTRGSANYAMSKFNEAIKDWEIVNKHKFGLRNSHQWLIRAYIEVGRKDDALLLLGKALVKNPKDLVCLELQSSILKDE